MSQFVTRALALFQAYLIQQVESSVIPDSLSSQLILANQCPQPLNSRAGTLENLTSILVAPTFPDGVEPGHWTPDRPDPYICEYLGLNGCWHPSELEYGPHYSHDGHWPNRSKTCVVPAGNDPDGDDAPAILGAFADCKTDGHIVFENTTYYVGTVMNTTGLTDVDIEVQGTLLWSDDIYYWLNNSISIGFQNQTSAWHLGGERIHFYGHGYGTLDGNGMVSFS
jgi:hypothetical protein